MKAFKCYNNIIFNKNNFVIKVDVRHRYALDPGSLKQRLFKAVTKPILPKPINEIKIEDENLPSFEKTLNNYGQFLVSKCKNEIIDSAKRKMLLIFQMNHHKKYHLFEMESALFDLGLKYFYYPSSILKLAAKDTNMFPVIDVLCQNSLGNMTIVGECSPELCKGALNAIRKKPFIMLLGGILEYRIMNIDQIKEFANLKSLDNVYSTLLGNLSANQNELVTNLTSHQQNLVSIISELERILMK